MNENSFLAGLFVLALGSAGLTGCGERPEAAASVKKERSEGGKEDRTPLTAVPVEIREDGLAYRPGEMKPFTGESITPFPEAPWLVKWREPWTEGRRDGDKTEYFKNGKVKTLRRYEAGVPKHGASYHRNGRKKYEHILNAADKAEGPYQRWYENGVLEATAGLDAEERWHGDFKEWTEEGELKTHHVFQHGLLHRIIFESPASQAARLKAGVMLETGHPPAAAVKQ